MYWEWNPQAPLWPWVEKFFTIELLYEYEGKFENATPRLCRIVGQELKHQMTFHFKELACQKN